MVTHGGEDSLEVVDMVGWDLSTAHCTCDKSCDNHRIYTGMVCVPLFHYVVVRGAIFLLIGVIQDAMCTILVITYTDTALQSTSLSCVTSAPWSLRALISSVS
jgi:hypothetical protein